MRIMNKENRNSGFSLVQVLISMGVLGAGALTFMQIQNNNISANKKTETRYDVSSLAQDINSVLIDGNACRNTFSGRNFLAAVGTTTAFNGVRDGSAGGGKIVYGTGPVIANTVNVDRYQYRIETSPVPSGAGRLLGAFSVSFFYQEASGVLRNSTIYEKKIDQRFKVVTDMTGLIVDCFSDSGSSITENVRVACSSVGGDFDETTFRCRLGSTRTFPNALISDLGSAGDHEGISYGNFNSQIIPNLLDRNFLQRTGGTVEDTLIFNGRLILSQEPVIGTDAVNLGYIDRLFQCPAGSVGVYTRSTNSINCRSLMCNDSRTGSQQYLAGIDSNGNPVCRDLVTAGDLCPSGGALRAQPNGSVRYECCTATCNESANFCPGVQYSSTNGCGTCTGTKTAINSEWGPWTDTGLKRETGACVANTVQVEKQQLRVCNGGNECGSNNCSGSNERWVASGTTSCFTLGKTCTTTCDCDGGFDVCESGRCVNRENSCVEGTYSRGDNMCQWICMGAPNQWGCAADGRVCNGGPILVTTGSTLGGFSTGGFSTTGGFSGGSTTTGGSSGGSSGPCVNFGGSSSGGMLDSGSNGTTTSSYQEPCLNQFP